MRDFSTTKLAGFAAAFSAGGVGRSGKIGLQKKEEKKAKD
jgi:hypothetical protein